MFDLSWTELFVLTGIGLAMVGKKDLPHAANTVGTQIGRIVGLLQGARARADKFAAQSELRQLQNELRSGLRELDAVKAELAVSISPGQMMGRSLGPMTGNADNLRKQGQQGQMLAAGAAAAAGSTAATAAQQQQQAVVGGPQIPPPNITTTTQPPLPPWSSQLVQTGTTTSPGLQQQSYSHEDDNGEEEEEDIMTTTTDPSSSLHVVPIANTSTPPTTASTLHQTTAAVAEEEWQKQGIGFASAAERGMGLGQHYESSNSGVIILATHLQQSLVFDQYDRVVQQQDEALQSKLNDKIMVHKPKTSQ